MSVHPSTVAEVDAPALSGNPDVAGRTNPNRAVFVIPTDPMPAHALSVDDLAAYIRHHLPRAKAPQR